MIENYMVINNIWMLVLIVQADTAQTFSNIIMDGNIQYSVTPLKTIQTNGKFIYYFIIRSKEYIVLPDDAKQTISTLQSANAALGKQVSSLTLANTALGKQVAALSIKIGGAK